MSFTRTVGVYGLTDSALRKRLRERSPSPATTQYKNRDGDFRITVTADTQADADAAVEELRAILNVYAYGVDVPDLATRVVQLLTEKEQTLATAESCTGGLLSAMVTAVPGASAVFECGVAAYSAAIKQRVVGVSAETLRKHSTISAQTAAEMAIGVRQLGNARLGIGITGAAGPSASEGYPAGTVFVAMADDRRVWHKQLNLDGEALGRDKVRRAATLQALDLVRRYLEAYPAVAAGGELLATPAEEPPEPDLSPISKRPWKRRLLPHKRNGLAENFRIVSLWLIVLIFLIVLAGLLAMFLNP